MGILTNLGVELLVLLCFKVLLVIPIYLLPTKFHHCEEPSTKYGSKDTDHDARDCPCRGATTVTITIRRFDVCRCKREAFRDEDLIDYVLDSVRSLDIRSCNACTAD